MKNQDTSVDAAASKRSWRGFIITVVAILVVLAVMILNSPRGFETDLTKIGSGQPALVLAYDPNLVVTGEQIHELNQVRDEFEPEMHFLLADVGYAEAREFMNKHQLSPGLMLIFSGEGEPLKRLQAPLAAEQLRSEIRATLP